MKYLIVLCLLVAVSPIAKPIKDINKCLINPIYC